MADSSNLSRNQIAEVLRECDLECGAELVLRVEVYLRFLSKWNSRMNLTGLRSSEEILRVLMAESFFAASLVENAEGSILDIGSGAGFPGLAMSVYRPEMQLVLLEPRKKRAAFLSALRRELGLSRVTVWGRKLEECSPGDFSTPPTVLTMRAVGAFSEVIGCGIHLLQGSRRVLLFSSIAGAEGIMGGIQSVLWSPPHSVRWNPQHVVLLGQVHGDVSRETLRTTGST